MTTAMAKESMFEVDAGRFSRKPGPDVYKHLEYAGVTLHLLERRLAECGGGAGDTGSPGSEESLLT